MPTTITAKCKAFTSERRARRHLLQVDADGVVRVYDEIARHYTTCHVLSEDAQERIRALAAKAVA